MEPLNGFDESLMIDDKFLLNFTDDGGSSTLKYDVYDSSSSSKTTAFGPATQNDLFPVDESDPGKPRLGNLGVKYLDYDFILEGYYWECQLVGHSNTILYYHWCNDPIEDLEWLMDKEAFPPLESFFGVLSEDSEFLLNHLTSPISVLNTFKTNGDSYNILDVPVNHPKRTRSNKRRRRRMAGYGDLPSQHCLWSNHSSAEIRQEPALVGRRCQHCLVDKTPQWRAGPMGPKTLCNACGVRYKSGRLHPEYRPACSPTFSTLLHSNSHKKVMEMRMKKQGD